MKIIANAHATLGATVEGVDLASGLPGALFPVVLRALAEHGLLRISAQQIEPEHLEAFAALFGSLEIDVADSVPEPGQPEVMTASTMERDGEPIGLSEAGQEWHTDRSYSAEIAFANVLHAITIPGRDGVALGSTEFANMYLAYDELPEDVRDRLKHATATHDFNKFWEEMRRRPGSTQAPLTPEQRAKKPPVSHPVFLRHPVSDRVALYVNPAYTVKIDGWDKAESDAMLDFLFRHQVKDKYRYRHRWAENDVLIWDGLCTIHDALPGYRADEPQPIKRWQVMADRVFDPAFLAGMGARAA